MSALRDGQEFHSGFTHARYVGCRSARTRGMRLLSICNTIRPKYTCSPSLSPHLLSVQATAPWPPLKLWSLSYALLSCRYPGVRAFLLLRASKSAACAHFSCRLETNAHALPQARGMAFVTGITASLLSTLACGAADLRRLCLLMQVLGRWV